MLKCSKICVDLCLKVFGGWKNQSWVFLSRFVGLGMGLLQGLVLEKEVGLSR